MTSVKLISQEFFDEMLLENQDVFDYDDDDQAVAETVKELQNQQQNQQQRSAAAAVAAPAVAAPAASTTILDKHSTTLDYLSLTHPDSEVGKHDRAIEKKFIELARSGETFELVQAISSKFRHDDGMIFPRLW